MERIVKKTEAVAKIEGIRRIRRKNGERKKMLWVRFASVEEKVKVMKGKQKLRDTKKWISNDLTEKREEQNVDKKRSKKKE